MHPTVEILFGALLTGLIANDVFIGIVAIGLEYAIYRATQ